MSDLIYDENLTNSTNSTNEVINKRIDNLCLYNEIIPEFYQDLTNFDENKYMGEDFDRKIYKIICTLKAKYINYIASQYSPFMAFNNDDNFMTFTMSFEKQFDYQTSYTYDENETVPFFITINKTGLICQFVEPLTMIQKLSNSNMRYLSYEVDLSDIIFKKSNSAHSVLVVFDQASRESYLLDSNGTLDYFDTFSGCLDNNKLKNTYSTYYKPSKIKDSLLESFKKYSDLIGYKFKTTEELNLDLSINCRIKSSSQKDFFQGYCRAWSLYFQAILSNAPYDFDAIRYFQQFSQYDLILLNEIIEMFQVYIYNKYLKNIIAINDLPNMNFDPTEPTDSTDSTDPTDPTYPTDPTDQDLSDTEQIINEIINQSDNKIINQSDNKIELDNSNILDGILTEDEMLEQIILISIMK